jgi:hypothetical protein
LIAVMTGSSFAITIVSRVGQPGADAILTTLTN